MKKYTTFYFIMTAFAAIAVFQACKRELSCEGCTVNNKPPIAVAGPDAVITLPTDSVLLDGSGSNDPDGTISEWLWTKISGPASFAFSHASEAKTMVKSLAAGTYQFELKVTDDGGLSAKDTVMITVDAMPATNHPPVACAGADQTITLTANTVTLDGSCSTDPDNNITTYEWAKIGGPSSFIIANINAVQSQVSSLTEGTYLFELKVTDAGGLFDRDTIQITVTAVNKPPACTDCKIVFVSNRDGNTEIYSCNADGSNITRLTNNAGTDDQPSWSPNGLQIAFVSDRTGDPEIYIMNADGSNVVQKTFSGSYSQNPSWSPDGTRIIYSTLSNGSLNIWAIGSLGGAPSLLFEKRGYEDYPSWSPDGTKMVLVSDWNAYDIVYDIFTVNSDGTNFQDLTGNIYDQVDYLCPSWSPSGTKIAMAISHGIGVNQYNTKVGIMNPDGSGLTAIISGAALWTRTSWSADGTRIAYTSLSGSRKDISWVSADGSASGTIVTNGWNADWQH